MSNTNKTFAELIARTTELMAELALVREEIIPLLPQVLMALVAETPGLTSITWHQYTPRFNDGDPCTFSTTIDYPQINGYCYNACDWADDVPEAYADMTDEQVSSTLDPLCEVVKEFLGQFDEDLLEAAFGDDMAITVTATEFKKEGYDCGY